MDRPDHTVVSISKTASTTKPAKKPNQRIPFHHDRTTICCSGHVVTSSDYLWLLLTAVALLGPLGMYTAVQANRVHNLLGWWWNVIVALLFIVTVVFAALAALNDPGILPRHTAPRAQLEAEGLKSEDDENDDNNTSKQVLVYHELNPQFLLGKDVTQPDGTVVFWKYCNTCELFRPPRCSHCSRCDNCVEEFDHHCPWLSNCIGKRNYRWFVLFVASVDMLAITVASLVFTIVYYEAQAMKALIYKAAQPLDWIVFSMAFFVALALTYMTGFHLNAIRVNKTTAEQIKSSRGRPVSDPPNPGFAANCHRIFCLPVPKRQVNWRQYRTP